MVIQQDSKTQKKQSSQIENRSDDRSLGKKCLKLAKLHERQQEKPTRAYFALNKACYFHNLEYLSKTGVSNLYHYLVLFGNLFGPVSHSKEGPGSHKTLEPETQTFCGLAHEHGISQKEPSRFLFAVYQRIKDLSLSVSKSCCAEEPR